MNICEHWFTTKERQATACAKLGIDNFIIRSIRQQHEKPSSTVLSNALTAIVGAIWLDLGASEESTSNACEEVFRISCRIDSAIMGTASTIDDRSSTAAVENDGSQYSKPGETLNPSAPNLSPDRLDASIIHSSGEYEHEPLPCSHSTLLSPEDVEIEFDVAWAVEAEGMSYAPKSRTITKFLEAHSHNASVPRLDPRTNGDVSEGFGLLTLRAGAAQSEQRAHADNREVAGIGHRPSDTYEVLQRAVKAGKRKHLCDHPGTRHNSSLYRTLFNEESETSESFLSSRGGDLQTLLDPARIAQLGMNSLHVERLRLLYVGIFGCHSLVQFKGSLEIARTKLNASTSTTGPNLPPMERFREIRLHDGQEALSVLVRRYHVVKLFETELETLRQENAMIMETPSNFGMSYRSKAGNPAVMQEAALTDRVLYKVAPNLQEGTTEFKKTREDLTQLRRLARRLQMLVKHYGFGILTLLPSGPSYSEITMTDRMLVSKFIFRNRRADLCRLISIPEGLFAQFSERLYEQHRSALTELSKAVEPVLTALVDGRLASGTFFPIEFSKMSDLEGLSVGSQELLDICLRGSPAILRDLQFE